MTALDELWVAEAHDRLDAFDRGEFEAVSCEDVFAEIESMLNDAVGRRCGCNNASEDVKPVTPSAYSVFKAFGVS